MEKTKEGSLKSVDIHVDALIANEDNTNQMDEKTLERLAEEIREVGFLDPINVVPKEDGNYIILGGEHRWRAAKIAGLEYIPAVVHTDEKWQDRDLFDLVTFRLNAIQGKVNNDKFVKMYERMSQKFGHDSLQQIFAVTQDNVWKKMVKDVSKQLKNSGLPDNLINKLENSESIKNSPDKFASFLDRIFKDHGNSLSSNFVIFSHGKKDHVLIHANTETFNAIKIIVDASAKVGVDVNNELQPLLQGLAQKMETLLASQQ